MMFQKDTLLPWMTVAENVALHHRFRNVRRHARQERAMELLELVGLADFENRHPYELSGGMRRRVALLTAIAPQPQVLLLDEPFSSLDEPTRVVIHQEMFDLIRRLGVSTILVTHDLAEAISLCDEVAVMSPRPGRIVNRYSVPFGSSRRILQLRQSEEFLSLYGAAAPPEAGAGEGEQGRSAVEPK
jgi:ABC-type nitrate/sulfonate/bicarbonate transport system ATPase subunit